ncbi:MAG: glycosyltransferase [Solirubrobacteraceae bacterium]|nr:glycosyltransferase [Solirubrobacteraceae bacterium]
MRTLPPLPPVPLVSVYTPFYNQERFVARAIESVLAIDWPADRLEYLVIDDGSTDTTLERIQAYEGRVRIIHQSNQGVRNTVNRALEQLSGDVICCVAGDDECPPDRVQTLVQALREHPDAGLAYSDLEIIDEHGRTIAPSFMASYALAPHQGRIRGKLLAHNFVSGGGMMLRGALKDVFQPIPDHAAWEDYWWAWAISGVADVVYVPKVTYRYRQHDRNISLGAAGTKLAAAQREELRFRRWMLTSIHPGEANVDELLNGIGGHLRVIAQIAEAEGIRPGDVLVADAEERARAAQQHDACDAALADGEVEVAAFALAAGLALDPMASGGPARLAALRAAHDDPALDLRGFVVLADAEEVLADDGLLTTFAASFGEGDDATLLVRGDEHGAALARQLTRLGLDGPEAPDMLLVRTSGHPAAFVSRARAGLGRAGQDRLPCFDRGAELRALAERSWWSQGWSPSDRPDRGAVRPSDRAHGSRRSPAPA